MNYNQALIKDRVFGLDIMRALAIILVVKSHGAFLVENTFLKDYVTFKMIDGVDLFFVLSGFLIGSILLKEINGKIAFGGKELLGFWKRRWFRTLPNYYLILILNFVVVYFGVINEDISQFNWRFLFFLQNFSTPFKGFFWESWSLTVEEWFYIISPLSLIVFLKFFSAKNTFILTTILMIIVPLLYRISIMDAAINDFNSLDSMFRKLVLTRLDSIAYGLFAAWIHYYYSIYWIKFRIVLLIVGISLIFFILNYNAPYNSLYRQVIYFTISPIAAMFLLPFLNSIKIARGKIAKAVTHISKISYSMYLINYALVAEVMNANFSPTNEIDGVMKYLLFWILVIAGSTLLYQYFERPMLKLRDK